MHRSKTSLPKRAPAGGNVSHSVHFHRSWFRIKRYSMFAIVAILCVAAWAAWTARLHVEGDRLEQAVRFAERGQLLTNELTLRTALARDPGNETLLSGLARGLEASERLTEAETLLTQWCQLHPQQAEAYRRRMDVNHRRALLLKDGTERRQLEALVLADGQRAIEMEPDDLATAQNVVWLCLDSFRYDEADRVFQRHLTSRGSDPDLLYLHARVCYARGAAMQAQELLEQLLAMRPEFAPAMLLRAILHNEAGEAEQAIPLLRRVIAHQSQPNNLAYYHLAMALARVGQFDESKSVMASVQRDNLRTDTAGDLENPAVRVRQAELQLLGGQPQQALASLQSVLEQQPNYPAAHRVLADYYQRQGDAPKSLEHRRRSQNEAMAEP